MVVWLHMDVLRQKDALFISCNKCSTLVGDIGNGRGYDWVKCIWDVSVLLSQLAGNLKLYQKISLFLKRHYLRYPTMDKSISLGPCIRIIKKLEVVTEWRKGGMLIILLLRALVVYLMMSCSFQERHNQFYIKNGVPSIFFPKRRISFQLTLQLRIYFFPIERDHSTYLLLSHIRVINWA